MILGVMTKTSSVVEVVFRVLLKAFPRIGKSPKRGTFVWSNPFEFSIRPPKIMVSPLLTMTTVESFFSVVSGATSLGVFCFTSSSEYLKLLMVFQS